MADARAGLRHPGHGRVRPGSVIEPLELVAIDGSTVRVPDPLRTVHLQFRRFAGCPVCNLHLRSVVRRHDEIEAAGIVEVVLFHSPARELQDHARELPPTVVADPDRVLYRTFGVEAAPRALLDPRVYGPILRAVVRSAWAILRRRERPPSRSPHGGRVGLPADLLIGVDGQALATHYGEHAYDQWSVDELLALAGGRRSRQVTEPLVNPSPGARRPG